MRLRLLFISLLLLPTLAFAESFRVNDIRLEGLQRVSAGTVFASLPIEIGETVDSVDIRQATRALFKTGFFADIQIGRDGGVLVVAIKERPAISEIVIGGNKAIKTEDLMVGLTDNGLSAGQLLKRATLEGLTQELGRQYVAQGRYSASVEAVVVDLPLNQVRIEINVDEGSVAAIRHLNIVGNSLFSDAELLDLFELQTTGWLSWITSNDRYSKEKLTGDIERVESHYLDRGYLKFNIDSTQVSLSPDKETVYITINITEGGIYTVKEVSLAGEPVVPEEQLKRLLLLREGQTFSQQLMTTTSDYITRRLGNEGYTFAEVRGIPELHDEDNTVDINFFMDPGKRAYVNRISFRGNTKSSDEVLRREMRQMEGGSASTSRIEMSKVRLERLGFFKEVLVDTVEVPGTADQVNIDYTVEEQPSGSIGASLGFAQGTGLVLGANVQQNNWFGTGKRVGFNVSASDYQQVYSFNYSDPYFTPDGVSRGFSVFFRARDLGSVNVSSYATDTYGASVNFGYPISEIERLSFAFNYSNISITTGNFAAQEIKSSPNPIDGVNFVTPQDDYLKCIEDSLDCGDAQANITAFSASEDYLLNTPDGWIDANGNEFDTFSVTGGWSQSTLNRGTLATRGAAQSASVELSIPGGGLAYYKIDYRAQYFKALTRSLTLRLRGNLGYGDGYQNTTAMPFFENYYAGGFGSVRGFKRNTLGPRATPALTYVAGSAAPVTGENNDFTYLLCTETDDAGCIQGKLRGTLPSQSIDAFGGNILVELGAEIIFPLPFIKDQRSMQSSVFIDAGNSFSTSCGQFQANCFKPDLGELSSAAGIGLP